MRPEIPFVEFSKIPRLNRGVVITEKIDGTNAQIYIPETADAVYAGSRSRWITPDDDNYGFARWVQANRDDLLKLGPGSHFGEWWGSGIQRRYGLTGEDKRFSLFNTSRWSDEHSDDKARRPACCGVVPVLASGSLLDIDVRGVLEGLRDQGSVAAPGFMQPEGIVVYFSASRTMHKMTLDKNDGAKGDAR